MKKITILLMFVGLFVAKVSFAGSADLFNYDAKAVQSELSALNAVDQFVEQNDITYSQMLQMNNPMASELSYGSTGAFGIQMLEPVAGIPSFVWGFCAGVAGIAVVYFVTEDNDETKKAAYGCIAGTAAYVGCYFIYVFMILASAPY